MLSLLVHHGRFSLPPCHKGDCCKPLFALCSCKVATAWPSVSSKRLQGQTQPGKQVPVVTACRMMLSDGPGCPLLTLRCCCRKSRRVDYFSVKWKWNPWRVESCG